MRICSPMFLKIPIFMPTDTIHLKVYKLTNIKTFDTMTKCKEVTGTYTRTYKRHINRFVHFEMRPGQEIPWPH